MTCFTPWLTLLTIVLLTAPILADEKDGFVPLFNGQDFSGWVIVNVGPNTFTVRDGRIICTGKRRRGPIGLQHQGDPIEFTNFYLRELKSRE